MNRMDHSLAKSNVRDDKKSRNRGKTTGSVPVLISGAAVLLGFFMMSNSATVLDTQTLFDSLYIRDTYVTTAINETKLEWSLKKQQQQIRALEANMQELQQQLRQFQQTPPLELPSSKDQIVDTKNIRSWGCNLSTTPLIFVHIGKSGGGSTRARFSGSALNFTADQKWFSSHDGTGAYYPVVNNSGYEERGFLCYSGHCNYRMTPPKKSFEATLQCEAMTPLGLAVACPETLKHINQCGGCNVDSHTCHQVYVGHNVLGSELHWLPPKLLQDWWKTRYGSIDELGTITERFQSLSIGNTSWCEGRAARPKTPYQRNQERTQIECRRQLAGKVDNEAMVIFRKEQEAIGTSKLGTQHDFDVDWSPFYASLPVLRTTLIREPLSWLSSKWFWHNAGKDHSCTNSTDFISWVSETSLVFIVYLCGEDCAIRAESYKIQKKDMTPLLDQFERQAANNLRQSFAVVGLLTQEDVYYKMINARIDYVDPFLNLHLKGKRHNTNKRGECKNVFGIHRNETTEMLLELSPEFAILHRLFEVAKEVNQFQKEELQQCSGQNMTHVPKVA